MLHVLRYKEVKRGDGLSDNLYRSSTETVEGTARALQRVDDIEGSHGFARQ